MAEFFRRIEKKYIINKSQYLELKNFLNENMVEDSHGKSTICNIYFDSENYDLIRHSITKPVFKEKVRLRSYNIPTSDSIVFLEIKRKYEEVVSKRRIEMNLREFYEYEKNQNLIDGQIENELKYYFKFYKLKPKMFLSYSRTAYYDKGDPNFRVTFDNNILARNYDLRLESGIYGTPILDKDKYIMEIKTLGAIPLNYVKKLNELKTMPAGFSKYGEAYTQLILNINHKKEEKLVC